MALHELKIIVIDGGKIETVQKVDAGQGNIKQKTDATPKTRVEQKYSIEKLREMRKNGETLTDKQKEKLRKADNERIANILNAVKDPVGTTQSKIKKYTAYGGAVAGLAIQFAKQSINYHVSNIGRSTGDSNYQAIVNRKLEIVNDFMNVGASILGGAASGAMVGNVPGAVVGAVVGLTSSLMNIGFRQAERERSYQHTIFQESNSQASNLARANFSATTGRLR